MADYERYHYDKEKLKEISLPLGIIVVDQEADLEQVRMHINRLWEDLSKTTNNGSFPALSPDWCFLDSCTAERYFRIDRAQENLHYVMDISGDELNILDPDLVTTRPKNEDDASTSEKDTTSANSELHVNGGDASLLERHSAEVIAAAEKGDLKWMKELSSKGFSLLSIDENGRTALHHAAVNGQMDIIRFLIASAPVTILDMVDADSGRTALHMAASARRRNICCMLVAAGGSLSQKDAQGQTPRELALVAGDQELANYLKSQETFQKMVSSNMETTV